MSLNNTFKIVLLGLSSLRMKLLLWFKNIIERTKDPDFKQHIPTGFENLALNYKYKEEDYRLVFWDVSESKDYSNIRPLNYQGTNLFIFVYEAHNQDSFDLVLELLSEVNQYSHSVPFIILGVRFQDLDPRVDISRAREIKERYGGSLAQEIEIYTRISIESVIPEFVKFAKYGKREIKKRKSFKGKVPKDYFGYNVNFYSIFKVDTMETSFYKFLEQEKNTEPMDFLRMLKKFETETEKTEKIVLFKTIVETFILKDSPKWVNISGRTMAKVIEKYQKGSEELEDVFLETEKEVLNDLKIDVWSRFLYTDLGYEAICECSSLNTVITEDPILILLSKFENSSLGEKLDANKLKEFSKILSNANVLLQTYLSSKWKDTIKLNELYQSSFHLSSTDKLMNVTDTNLKSNVSVKILILERTFDRITSLINPIITTFNPTSEDLYYSAIMIGPFILEWNTSEICIPRKCVSKAAVMVSDIETNFSVSKMDKFLPSLAKLIVEYNINYGYHKRGEDKNLKFKNSQEFVEDVLKLIQMDINKVSPPLLQLLNNIKKFGYTKLDFEMSNQFQKAFSIDEKSVCFSSHEQLDLFVNRLMKINPNFQSVFKDEYLFLKGIDRAFWLKYNSLLEHKDTNKQMIDKYQPWIRKIYDEDLDETDEQVSCPFKDPSKTQSFLLGEIKTGFSFLFKK